MTEYSYGLFIVLSFLAVAFIFVFATLLIGRLARPNRPSADKSSMYECGERPIGAAWFNFNPRFYIIALIFIVFDVEIALTFPVAMVFRDWMAQGHKFLAWTELTVFIAILFMALVYVWSKGDLDWMKKIDHEIAELKRTEK